MSTGSAVLDAPPAEALDLREGISLLEAARSSTTLKRPDGTEIVLGYDGEGNLKEGGVFDEKGRVPLHIIRPGIGKGRGRHLYEAGMLEEAAETFTGWKMFLNHLSPEAKKVANGQPRDIRDTGGRVQESWWDPAIPANVEAGHGQGGVMGMVRPVKFIRNLIDDDPELAEASISASATGVRPVHRDGERVWLVEGIQPRGSVDWVTEAGAGGRIAALLQEAYSTEEDMRMALLESMSTDEIAHYLQEARPEVLEEAKKTDPAEEGGDDKLEAKVAELTKKGMPEKVARAAAKKALSESTEGDPTEGGDVPDITPEVLAEALSASPNLLVEAVQQNGELQVFLSSLVESKIEEERESLREENRADVDRAFQLARFERTAHEMINESKLPESWQTDLKERFSLAESKPSAELDVTDEVDGDGKVLARAEDRLKKSVEEAISKESGRLREASTTRVRAPQVAQLSESKTEDEKEKEKDKPEEQKGPKPYWAQTLAEAGIRDPESAYALEG